MISKKNRLERYLKGAPNHDDEVSMIVIAGGTIVADR
jgi:hypothetical protein